MPGSKTSREKSFVGRTVSIFWRRSCLNPKPLKPFYINSLLALNQISSLPTQLLEPLTAQTFYINSLLALNQISSLFELKNTSSVGMNCLSVPVIDLSDLHGSPTSRSIVVDNIGKACHQNGYFQVINHGIGADVGKDALTVAESFFHLPFAEKMELASDDVWKPVRYGSSMDGDVVQRLFLKHYAHPLEKWIKLWPSVPSEYRDKMGRYASEVRRLTLELMEAIMESLGLGRSFLKDKISDGTQVMTVNGYPSCRKPQGMICMPPHTDYSIITVLLQSFEGLEELDSKTDTWNLIPDVPSSLLVHGGNFLEVISNGYYKSALHRVASNPYKMRFSIASLHSLGMDEKVGVADELVDECNPKHYVESSFREFLEFLSSGNAALGGGMCYLDTLKTM